MAEALNDNIELMEAGIDSETSALVAAAMAENPLCRTVTTLSDGTVLEIIPYDATQTPDENLHEAARLLLECAEPVAEREEEGEEVTETVVMETDDDDQTATVVVKNDDDDDDSRLIVFEQAGYYITENDPVRIVRSVNEPRKGFCTGCQKIVEYKNRKRHLTTVHQIESSSPLSTTKCIHPDCDRTFFMVKSMMKHLETDHAVDIETKELSFPTWEDFIQWKNLEEDTNYVFFSRRSGECIRAGRGISYYICQRDGSRKPHRKKGYIASGRTTKKGTARQDLTCPARIKAYRSDEGVKVVYTFSHNHPVSPYDTIHQPLSKTKLSKIQRQLEKGINSDQIHANLSSLKADAIREPSHIVTKRRIDNIKKKLDKESRLSSEEPASVHMLVSKLQEQHNSPILLYGSDFICNNDGGTYGVQMYDPSKLFLILYQSANQLEMMKKFASRLLIIDTDGNTDNKEIQLVNVMVSDDFHRAYPVAHIITNNLQSGMQLSLKKLKERAPDLELNAVFAPNELAFTWSLNSVFEPSSQLKYFYGRWETVRQWEKKIKMTIFSSTIRRDLSQMLSMILDESDPNKFEILLEVFIKEFASKADRFLRFFEKNYAYVKRTWARCYREFSGYGTDSAEYMRKFTSRLDWWVNERQTNKRIDDLLNLLIRLDEEWWAQRQSDLQSYSEMADTEVSKHLLSDTIPDERIHPVRLREDCIRIWFVKGSEQNAAFVVKLVQETCEYDFCWDRCAEEACAGLCAHMYTCSCDDGTGLCEHVHKVRSFCHREDDDGAETRQITNLIEHTFHDFGSGELVVIDADQVQDEQYVQIAAESFADVTVDMTPSMRVESSEYLDVDQPGTSGIASEAVQ